MPLPPPASTKKYSFLILEQTGIIAFYCHCISCTHYELSQFVLLSFHLFSCYKIVFRIFGNFPFYRNVMVCSYSFIAYAEIDLQYKL